MTSSTDIFNLSIRQLKGVGDKRAQLFAKLHITTLGDLLRHYPRHYEDWSSVTPIYAAPEGQPCCVRAVAITSPAEHRIRKGMTLYRFQVSDGVTQMQITLFNNRYAADKVRRGEEYLFYGVVTHAFRKYEMTSPLIEQAQTGERIRPIYRQTEGLTSRVIESTVASALSVAGDALKADFLSPAIRERYALCDRFFALKNIHFPSDQASLSASRRRLIFEELFVLQMGMLQMKGRTRAKTGARMQADYTGAYYGLLPFSPTNAQRRAIADCVRDMAQNHPMSRLVQGDVGSGKTAVAAGAVFQTVKNGWQAAMMAPTEILAEQHVRSLSSMLAPGGIRVGLLTGSMPAAEKRETLAALAAGEIHLLVGTHALLSEGVVFKNLGLVITDEQHRFGVEQRAQLAAKGANPHLLVMSATPIPRTLALIIYGDLDVSVLDELPPGRQPIATFAVGSDKRERAYGYVKKHVAEGRQAYIVCPLVEDGEPGSETDLASATAYAQQLQQGAFRGYRLGLLHGRMRGAEKEAVMSAFAKNDISILVSTTVIEVGVDVPNAVLMVIENAERFGLAQLHQLRGRVGRGQYASTCILISDAQNEEAVRRLKVMCATNDGFRIADEDLKLRGPGDFFGNRQHGLPELKIADLLSDGSLLQDAQDAAQLVTDSDPHLQKVENGPLAAEVERLFIRIGPHGMN